MKIIAVANQKGGVGKTTTVINVGAGLSKKGKKVLCVDLDYQSSLSYCVGFEQDNKPTISELIFFTCGDMPIKYSDFIRHSDRENFDYIPAVTKSLSGISAYLASQNENITILSKIFSNQFFKKYDYILLDCSPSMDLLVTSALECCDKILIPSPVEEVAFPQTYKMIQSLVNIKKNNDINKYVVGILPNMYQTNQKHSADILQKLKDCYGDLLFPCYITYLLEVKNVKKNGSCVYNNSKSAYEYMTVVESIIKRIENKT